MRCSCPECGTYMVHSESMRLGCVCPQCGARCSACLGTDTVVSRDALRQMKNQDWFTPSFEAEESPERALPDDPVSREEDENPGRRGW
ncbi:MAG: hypothetical protein IKS52_02120 [Clostridia bacterium]|nr:hypothetical protein [Clostridia bacterium]MBR4442052.1 hypothetical protein [Clostridia bacterium]